jgi:hypothetical protein
VVVILRLLQKNQSQLTVGAVITPESVPGLTLTVDYFDITVEDGIGTVSAKTALINVFQLEVLNIVV